MDAQHMHAELEQLGWAMAESTSDNNDSLDEMYASRS